MSATRILTDGEWFDIQNPDFDAESPPCERGCRCPQCRQMGDEFIIRRGGEYVASIDTYDGDTTWTSDPRCARIFSGSEWVDVWDQPGYEMVVLTGDAYAA